MQCKLLQLCLFQPTCGSSSASCFRCFFTLLLPGSAFGAALPLRLGVAFGFAACFLAAAFLAAAGLLLALAFAFAADAFGFGLGCLPLGTGTASDSVGTPSSPSHF